jgi:hypothetical protein
MGFHEQLMWHSIDEEKYDKSFMRWNDFYMGVKLVQHMGVLRTDHRSVGWVTRESWKQWDETLTKTDLNKKATCLVGLNFFTFTLALIYGSVINPTCQLWLDRRRRYAGATLHWMRFILNDEESWIDPLYASFLLWCRASIFGTNSVSGGEGRRWYVEEILGRGDLSSRHGGGRMNCE